MTYRITCRLNNINAPLRRLLKPIQCLHPLWKEYSTKTCISAFPSRYHDDKYIEIRSRLASVPCLDLLEREVSRVHRDLCYENDERLEDIIKWFSKVFDYNTRTGRMIRVETFLKTFCVYGFKMDDTTWKQWDSERWTAAAMLAWCIELFGSHINMMDDMIDQSTLRRGALCWYKKSEVGQSAVNDALLLQSGIYKLLRKYFDGSRFYMNVLHEFQQVTLETAYGQGIDLIILNNRKLSHKAFTMEKYEFLTEYKAASYSYRLPVHLAMHLAGGYSEKDFNFTRKLCLKLGLYFQSKDDYLDCFGPKEYNGMIGNDIREGKLTWLAVKFFEKASESKKKEFLEHFGVEDENSINKVIELYRESNLLDKFQEFDEHIKTDIISLIESVDDVKGALFYDLFQTLQNRQIVLPDSS